MKLSEETQEKIIMMWIENKSSYKLAPKRYLRINIINRTSSKLKTVALPMTLSQERKDKLRIGRK